jgi:hypothetical protein
MTNNNPTKRSFFAGNCAVCGFFVTLAALAIYVMAAFPQAGY